MPHQANGASTLTRRLQVYQELRAAHRGQQSERAHGERESEDPAFHGVDNLSGRSIQQGARG